jgi:hypothetical protein
MWNYNKESNPQAMNFIGWAKHAIDQGQPVIFGVYWGVESDSDFDHIVPMVGYDDSGGGNIYFNDLHTNNTLKYALPSFVSSRKKCNNPKRFAPGSFCLPEKVDYGIIVHGNNHAAQVTGVS